MCSKYRVSRNIILIGVILAALFIGLTSFMPVSVYSSAWWISFWTVIGIGLIISVVITKLWRKPIAFMLHISFLLIIIGGGITFCFSQRGSLHLKPGIATDIFIGEDGNILALPQTVILDKFSTIYYPGTSFPRDFESKIHTESGEKITISMNNIAIIDGYRFYQTSFDNQGGSILTVTHDPAGIAITYSGYVLFAISGIMLLMHRARIRKHKLIPKWIFLFMLFCPLLLSAAPAISEQQGHDLERKQVLYNGRVISYTKLSHEFTLKITGRRSVGKLCAERFLASLILYPEQWSCQPVILIKNRELREKLGIKGKYASIAELYEDSLYKPQCIYEGGAGKLDNDILKLDEKVALLAAAFSGKLFTPLSPNDPQCKSGRTIWLEVLYEHLNPLWLYFTITFIVSLMLIFIKCLRRNFRVIAVALSMFSALVYTWLWLILGYAPLSGSAQVMQFLSLCIVIVSLIAGNRNTTIGITGVMLSSFVALVSYLSYSDPVMTPLMPVLSSNWLTIHVTLVISSYALLILAVIMAMIAVLKKRLQNEMLVMSRTYVLIGVYLLGLGIFTGAVWANISWGRYWAWDPKETWALVTMLVFAISLHRSVVPLHSKCKYFLILLLGLCSMIMTYAGVNLLPSLHAYQ